MVNNFIPDDSFKYFTDLAGQVFSFLRDLYYLLVSDVNLQGKKLL